MIDHSAFPSWGAVGPCIWTAPPLWDFILYWVFFPKGTPIWAAALRWPYRMSLIVADWLSLPCLVTCHSVCHFFRRFVSLSPWPCRRHLLCQSLHPHFIPRSYHGLYCIDAMLLNTLGSPASWSHVNSFLYSIVTLLLRPGALKSDVGPFPINVASSLLMFFYYSNILSSSHHSTISPPHCPIFVTCH